MEIIGQRSNGNFAGKAVSVCMVHQQVDDRQKSGRIDAARRAHLGDGLVAESEGDSEPAHHLQDGILIAYEIAHPVIAGITSRLIHTQTLSSPDEGNPFGQK